MNRRIVTYKCFDMTPARQKELRYFCSQYQEWKDKLEILYPCAKGQRIDGMPHSNTNNINDEAADLAIKRTELSDRINMIEQSAKEASPEFWQYIIKSVCYKKSYGYLKMSLEMPLSEAAFRDRVKMFLIILNDKRK